MITRVQSPPARRDLCPMRLSPDVLTGSIHVTINGLQLPRDAHTGLTKKQAIDKATAERPTKLRKVFRYFRAREGIAASLDYDVPIAINAGVVLRFVASVFLRTLGSYVPIVQRYPLAYSDDCQPFGKIFNPTEPRPNHNLSGPVDVAAR